MRKYKRYIKINKKRNRRLKKKYRNLNAVFDCYKHKDKIGVDY